LDPGLARRGWASKPSVDAHLRRTYRGGEGGFVSQDALQLARHGFAAWQQGDFDTIESILDPNVWWHWFEAGDWDCNSREDVMRTLRERYDDGFARAPLELIDAGDDVAVAVARPRDVGEEWPAETATVIRFRDGKVVSMQDHRTREDAMASVTK
jgi:ketosteroid isomerase-like protein